ncbi:MAG: phosphoadenosine phosphosulfate reductase family protein, partial [Gammaproteobacteria bacterium]
IWVYTGYHTTATYRHVDALTRRWRLNLHTYTPRVSAARQAALAGGVPARDDPAFMRFVRDTKLEPFERAFNELKPDLWFTGLRAQQSAFRRALGVVSRGTHDTLRIAPLHYWSARDLAAHLALHGIVDNDDYVDPTKPGAHDECGLQLLS